MGKYIECLYRAIKDRKINEAYKSYFNLAPCILGKRLFRGMRMERDDGVFVTLGYDAISVHWDKLAEEFVDILNTYKAFDSSQRLISIEYVDEMIDDFKNVT